MSAPPTRRSPGRLLPGSSDAMFEVAEDLRALLADTDSALAEGGDRG